VRPNFSPSSATIRYQSLGYSALAQRRTIRFADLQADNLIRDRDLEQRIMIELPAGIVTFLFTDIEGSTRLWERDRAAMTRAARRHDALLGAAIAAHQGVLFKHVGDAVQAAFASPAQAVDAAVAAQRTLAAEPWPETGPIRARMAIHSGEATPNERGDYHQVPSLNRLARLLGAGYGGQVLLSEVVQQAIAGTLDDDVTLRDLGRHRLRDLLEPEQVSQLVIAGLPADFPPLKTLEGHPTNLPTLSTALIGRETELAAIADLLRGEGHRLVTLVGPGGVGKTHLALQAAADLVDDFIDGVWLVRLGEVTDPALILPTIAAALGVREGGGLDLRQALLAWIGEKRLLLVLDNLEQVIAGAPVIAELLEQTRQTRVLATSRQRLGIGGERIVGVEPLPTQLQNAPLTQVAESPAVRLFVERARNLDPGFAVDERNAATIAALCERLDGLPLAIELAAAQLRTRTLAEILADLESRFDLLVGGRREALSHQHSLAQTINWSYERLAPEEQRLFRLYSVFAGGWSRDGAEALAAESTNAPRRLTALVEQSLVRRTVESGDVSRWSMLESIRAFGRERLEDAGEAQLAHERHAAWCLALVEEANRNLDSEQGESWLDRIDLEHDNARAALRWHLDTADALRALSLAAALGIYWQTRGHLSEGRRWLEAALAGDRTSHPALPAMIEAGVLAQTQGDFAAARDHFTRALDVAQSAGDRGREASLLMNLGVVALEQIDLDEAEHRFTQSLALAEELNDRPRRANVLGNLGALAHYRGDTGRALQHYMESLQTWRDLRDGYGIADMLLNIHLLLAPNPAERQRARAAGEEALRRFRALDAPRKQAVALAGLGIIAAGEGDLDHAAELHEESLLLARRIEDRVTEARALGNLAMVELQRANLDHAGELFDDLLRLARDLGERAAIAYGLEGIAALQATRREDEQAARLYGAAAALRDDIGFAMLPESRALHETVMAALTERLSVRHHELFAAGAVLEPEEAIAEALARGSAAPIEESVAAPLQSLDDLLGLTSSPARS
jgi:predicted ATPase/class 3 adenylate cyclase